MARPSRKETNMATPMPTDNKVTKKVTVFDATNLTPIKKEYSFTHVDSEVKNEKGEVLVVESIEDAKNRLSSYGEIGQKRLLTVLNNTLAFFSAREARKEAVGSSLSRKAVMDVVKAFRASPAFAKLNPGEGTKEGYQAQTDAILAVMRANPAMIAMIADANAGDDGGDEGEDDENAG